ncbi:Alpha/Beta hydrolase protein [Aspergillus pseudotamarii]|uniref:Alpha/Beta hydrolase protein n=1 Tax=Aspergillus pseudotamarii TaxID=132259 RepID=A0A5N6SUK5_ASPPS|nr:Alpha/Beta hydrolase protein [Aspergillus pseudotamarii]KAE8138366.1 Alpha/Beta hydrolase protein [Aspergillus pseudotamarii]
MDNVATFSLDNAPSYEKVKLQVDRVSLEISTIYKKGTRPPFVFLHGFGSSKEEFNDFAYLPHLSEYGLLLYDAPGCGDTTCSDLSKVNIPFLVKTAKALLNHYGVTKFHLSGHSMGGLTALLLASEVPDRVLSFVNIKGNLAPEDCFLSRQVFLFPADDAEVFFHEFTERARRAPAFSNAIYASNLRRKVSPHVTYGILSTMVEITDNNDLLALFLGFSFPRMFMYGVQNASLSYLPKLREGNVELAEIPYSGHFPMYSNPPEMFRRVQGFLERTGA